MSHPQQRSTLCSPHFHAKQIKLTKQTPSSGCSLSKEHHHLQRIPQSGPFFKIFSLSAIWSWLSSISRPETTQIRVLLSKHSLSVEVLIALGSLNPSHCLAFPSHLSICSGGDNMIFSPGWTWTPRGHTVVMVSLLSFHPVSLAAGAQCYLSSIAITCCPLTAMLSQPPWFPTLGMPGPSVFLHHQSPPSCLFKDQWEMAHSLGLHSVPPLPGTLGWHLPSLI